LNPKKGDVLHHWFTLVENFQTSSQDFYAAVDDVDASLLKTPVIGPIYEKLFRKETYYRQDTRLMYLQTVPAVVKEIAEEITTAKGVKLLKQYERKPILGELYQPVTTRLDEKLLSEVA
jgi:hypothetical protein